MIFNPKNVINITCAAALIGALSGCGSSGGDDGSGGGGGTTPPPSAAKTQMQAGIQPDATGLKLELLPSGGYIIKGKIYVVRQDGSTASSPQPPAVITLRIRNVTTGAAVFNIRANARTFTVVQPSGSTRPGWEYTVPTGFPSYTPGQMLSVEIIDDPSRNDDNLLEGNLEWIDTNAVPNVVKTPPIEIGTLMLLGSAG